MNSKGRTALLVLDMQLDFCHPEGAYARNGLSSPALAELIPRIARVMEQVRQDPSARIIASQFTVLTDGKDGPPIGLGHLTSLRPFLMKEGFRLGEPGREVVPELRDYDFTLLKTRYSAFYGTPLEAILLALGVSRLIFTGIATNGAVEATMRDAAMRDYECIVLEDCCASFKPAQHQASVLNMAGIGRVISSQEFLTNSRKPLTSGNTAP